MLYKLFKRIYADRILKDIHEILGYHELICSKHDYGLGLETATEMSFETFISCFKGR